MDYSKLSDVEINHAVASVLPGRYITYPDHVMNSETEEDFDPCNNAADAWPIIADNQISIIFNWNEEGLHGATNQPWISSENTNPLRAAMECLLMMQEHKHG
ncbi:phage protein NinX family protein [Lelliottia amnigena]|uniref:phage protein NinX family protein n=1 Tax=Lelliottia amnigena TaxID=61646 RepID=UPI001EF7602A|nr:phage protein NinX family protein [Lelliottia amnigena]MCG7781024.1 DUF2591 domain-containing protein [Lelliottia amnigena]